LPALRASRRPRLSCFPHTPGMPKERNTARLEYDAADEYYPESAPTPEVPAWKDGGLRIGIHTSIAGDIVRSLETAHELGANALQIFSASPRMWAGGTARIVPTDASRFRERRRELQLGPLVIHGNYLINLASPNRVLRARSMQAFHQEIVRAIDLGADYLVAHPGSFCDGQVEAGISAIAQGLRQAARGLKLGDLKLLLENTAGQGSSIGSTFGELKAILDACPELPLGVCIDTAHTFEAGWDLRTADGLESALRNIDRTVGLERAPVIHMNDSKTPLGSRLDRHQHIGKGKIGSEAFARILTHPLLSGRAFILETPIDKPGDDRRNVAALWKLAGRAIPARPKGTKKSRAAKAKPAGRVPVKRAAARD
jgi:deoxyribonuclease-4